VGSVQMNPRLRLQEGERAAAEGSNVSPVV
jgi:hypothetical protein